MASEKAKRQIVDAFMELLAERGFHGVSLAEVATRAGVPLSTFREAYSGKLAILADFSRRIDLVVLEGEGAEGGTARDRLFDAMMRRFDALASYRPAMRRLARSARTDLPLAAALHSLTARSQKWMLAAAGIERSGPVGRLLVEGSVIAYADAMRVWLDDEDSGLSATMAALDKALQRGAKALRFVDGVCARLPRPCRRAPPAETAEMANSAG